MKLKREGKFIKLDDEDIHAELKLLTVEQSSSMLKETFEEGH